MPSEYRSARPEFRRHASLLSGISDAVQGHVEDNGVRAVAESIGAARSTVHDWKADLHSWPAAPLLTLARNVPAVGDAVIAYLERRKQPAAEATAAVRDAFSTASTCSELINELLAAIVDGKFDAEEGARVRMRIARLSALLPILDMNVAAATRGAQ